MGYTPDRRGAFIEPIAIAATSVLTIFCFVWALPFYFLSDEFNFLDQVRSVTWAHVPHIFTYSGEGFFRPLGHITLWMQAPFAGLSPTLWRLSLLAAHLATCIAVFLFTRRLYPGTRVPVWTMLIFAIHGSHPESVNWLAQWFAIVATFLAILSLHFYLTYDESGSSSALFGSLLCLALGILNKESVYITPLLATIVARYKLRSAPLWILAIAMWIWRWRIVGGFGGYDVHPSFLGTMKALGLRLWAVLFFPINWSQPLAWYLAAALPIGVVALILLARAHCNRSELVTPFAFILIPAIPVAPLLLIGSDLLNARSVYMSVIGFAMLIAVAIESVEPMRVRGWIATGIVVFQIAALEHNLAIRGRVAALARTTCESIISVGNARVVDVPMYVDGVHFFANGLPQCVDVMSGGKAKIDDSAPVVLRWDSSKRTLIH